MKMTKICFFSWNLVDRLLDPEGRWYPINDIVEGDLMVHIKHILNSGWNVKVLHVKDNDRAHFIVYYSQDNFRTMG